MISFFLRRGKTIFLTVDVNGIHFVSLSPGKPLKKKNENIYLRGLIFPPAMFFFFFFFMDERFFAHRFFGMVNFLLNKKKKKQNKEPNRPNPLSLSIVTMSAVLMTSNCFVRGFVECFMKMVPLVNWLTD